MKKDWETKTLGDFFDITSSKRVFKSDWTSGGVPFYRAREIVSLSKNKPLKDPIFISSEMYEEYASKYGKPEEGDILVTGVGTLGICYVVKKNDKFYFKDGNIIWLKNISNVNTKFVEYFFKSKELIDQINSAPMGATVGTFTIIRAKNTTISIPSASEQKRIVKILDEKFEAIAELKKIAEEQLSSAKELFESRLNEVLGCSNDDWLDTTLGEVCDLAQGLAINIKTKHFLVEKSSLPLLRIKDLKNNTNEQYVDDVNYPKNCFVDESDLIYTRTGQVGLVFKGRRGILHNNSFKVIPRNNLDRDFMFWWLQNPTFKTTIISLSSKAAQPDITHKIFKVQKINLPPKNLQIKISKELDELSKKKKALEAIFQRKITDLVELKKSYLHEAFSGKL